MKSKDFISRNVVLPLPTKANPKVYLAVGSSKIATLSFSLYNPFSSKGKVLKWLAKLLFEKFNRFSLLLLPVVKNNHSDFIKYIEEQLGAEFISSVYIATANDKVVLQLIKKDEIYGYLKFPLTKIGIERLENEKKAIDIFSEKSMVSSLLYSGSYKGIPFIIIENIEGQISELSKQDYLKLIPLFYKNNTFKLREHPRVIAILKELKLANLRDLESWLWNIIKISELYYKEVYEHGDFAPWNIIQTDTGLVPFDFEYFEETGLEYMDELKYHHQIETLLNLKEGEQLIDSISSKINIPDFKILYQIFLIKEILRKIKIKESVENEKILLNIISGKR
ncbi:hypothetical protein [Maribacter aquivivus]|uniref:hypothetical protein n=1 Tax=Maribacter aquivivus TaxID=228958 RepID=UPI0024930CC1|nr:hypothetical protein [Maribacter aquivivus]